MRVYIDTLNLIFMAFHVTRKQLHDKGEMLTNDNIGFFLHMLLNRINQIFANHKNITFCWEGEKSLEYRKSIFPDYKENRKDQKAEDEYITLKSFLPKLREILECYPSKHIKHLKAEADDVIFALCEKYQDEDIVIMSSDKDLTQIGVKFPNVSVYNPIFKKSIAGDPNIILEKAVCGDPSDNIPGLYRVGPKTLEKMLASEEEFKKVINKGKNKVILESFLNIVDLSKYPKKIHDEIKEMDEKIDFNKFNYDQIELYFWEYKMQDMLNRWGKLKADILINLNEEEVQNKIIDSIQESINNKDLESLPKSQEEKEIDDILAEYL